MLSKSKSLLVALVLVLLVAPAAFGALSQVGPVNPISGFPEWYMDANGVALELPVPVFGNGLTAPTMIHDDPIVGNAYSQTIGFGAEAFYYIARARIDTPTFGRLTFLVGLEASFGGGVALNGDQMVFSRLRCVLPGNKILPVGTYTLRHPYGTDTIVVDATGVAQNRAIAFTRDIGTIPLNFAAALAGDVGPFLTAVPLPGPFVAPVPIPFQTGWIGDGVTPTLITGSPIGFNQVSLSGPGGTFATSTFELVSGHRVAVGAGVVTVDRLTYTRNATSLFFDIFATAVTGSAVTAQIGAAAPVALTEGINTQVGHFFVHAPGTSLAINPVTGQPAPITVSALLGVGPPVTASKIPVDLVTITQAQFNPSTNTLTLAATSSDTVLNPALNVVTPALGPLVPGVAKNFLAVAPETVTISSAAGGSATMAVTVLPLGAVVAPGPVPAPAPVPGPVPVPVVPPAPIRGRG